MRQRSNTGVVRRSGPDGPISCQRAALYARVSTTDQNCEMQLRELREYCARRGWIVQAEYVDEGWSGAKASRPQLDALMQAAAERRFDVVLVWKLDRFGRSVLHLNQQLAMLSSHGVRFIATSQGLDTDQSNPTSRLLLQILASVAEFEREMIRERVRAGMRAAKSKGKAVGRRRVLFDRSKALSMHAAGASLREIASALGVGRGTVERVVSQKAPAETDR
jgi:putative DNA-invertase from lambdoid prophage Rac